MFPPRTLLSVAACALVTGCSVRRYAVGTLADALSDSTAAWASESDPALVRDAMPFALKTFEGLLIESPEDRTLLLAVCSGFTQYAYAFVQLEAERMEHEDWEASERLSARALALYLRARDHGLRALEVAHPGIGERLRRDPEAAAAEVGAAEIETAYWTAASWGSAISLALDRPEIVADLDAARALMRRCLELDEGWGDGAIHEAMISIESLPEMMGGSPERAREHFERAVELSGGRRPGPFVACATGVSLPQQDRDEFEALLERALAIDPDADPSRRLATILAQRKAEHLLAAADDLFL